MTRVITYGTYDLLHYGHINLLKRAKALGDYLIVGVTADDFDRKRGKINVKQSLMERIEAVKSTGLADEIIVEEYEGQKIDDIRRLDVDIFTVGSDWVGKFDYLNEYCKVVYLDRTEGISSSDLRAQDRSIRMGIIGDFSNLNKFVRECSFVNGIHLAAVCTHDKKSLQICKEQNIKVVENYDQLLKKADAVYIATLPEKHYELIDEALEQGKHVLCETPITLDGESCRRLFEKADEKPLILMEALKTAYATAYNRLLVLVKSGRIGNIVSVETTCTSLNPNLYNPDADISGVQNSICGWGPTAMLPIFQIFGTDYQDVSITSFCSDRKKDFDLFTKINFRYPHAIATATIGKGVKSEGSMVISGTKGYLYVPAPWWKTDYFELRYENTTENNRYFYQLDGEGIRYEIVTFLKAIETGKNKPYIPQRISEEISNVIQKFYEQQNG